MIGAVLGGIGALASAGATLSAGAMVASASLLNTGVRMANLTYNIGSDVVSGATGLVKGVGSAMGETTDTPKADQSTSDAQGKKALPPGVKLNKNGVMVQDKGAKGGGQILPGQFDEGGNLKSLDDRLGSMEAPDRGDAGPVQQILDYVKVIAANTARTAAGVGALSTNMQGMSAQSNIDDEKPPMTGEGKQGIFGKMFGGIGKTMKAVGSSLGKTAKFMIKGLALGGLLYLFLNKKEDIQESLAGIFQYFHELYLKLKDSDDPMGDVFKEIKKQLKKLGDKIVTMFKEFYNETIQPMFKEMMENLTTSITNFVNSILFGEGKTKTVAGNLKSQTAINELEAIKLEGGLNTDDPQKYNKLGLLNRDIDGGLTTTDTSLIAGDNMTSDQRIRITDAAKRLYQGMWETSMGSGGQIQWTNMPFMSKGLSWGKFLSGLTQNSGLPYLGGQDLETMMKSKPIIAGNIMERTALDPATYDPGRLGGYNEATMSAAVVTAIKEQNVLATNLVFQKEGQGTLSLASGNWSDWDAWVNTYEKLKTMGDEKAIMNHIMRMKSELSGIDLMDMPAYRANNPDQILEMEMLNQDFRNTPLPFKGVQLKQFQRDLELYLKHIEQESSGATNLVDASVNDNKMIKQGDTIQMPLSVSSSDPTANAFHEWYHA